MITHYDHTIIYQRRKKGLVLGWQIE